MEWINAPASWREDNDAVIVTSAAGTDFWRKTHYGFIRDNGHLYSRRVEGDFSAQVRVTGQYNALYDQAGLMIRLDETCWIKCGIEYVEGVQYVSAVVTRDFSDWSVSPLRPSPDALWIRAKREGASVEVSYSLDGNDYALLRVTHLTDEPVQVGLMIASPDGEGFSARFEHFQITPLAGETHAASAAADAQ